MTALTQKAADATQEELTPLFDTDTDLAEVIEINTRGKGFKRSDLDKVTLPSGSTTFWSVPGADGKAKPVEYLEGFLLVMQDHRGMYLNPTQKAEKGKAPDCTSEDMIHGRNAVSFNQYPKSGLCADCPLMKWTGSKEAGWQMKCKTRTRLYILPAGEQIPFILDIPATSVKALEATLATIAKRIKRPYYQVPLKIGIALKNGPNGEFAQIAPFIDIATNNLVTPQDRVWLTNAAKGWSKLMAPRNLALLAPASKSEDQIEAPASADTDQIDTDQI